MRATMIAMLAAAAMGFFSPSGVSAAPANGAVIGEAAAAGQMNEKTRRYRRYPHRRAAEQGGAQVTRAPRYGTGSSTRLAMSVPFG